MKTGQYLGLFFAVLLAVAIMPFQPARADLQIFGDNFEDPVKTASQWTSVDSSGAYPGTWELRKDDDTAGVGILHASKLQGGPAPASGVLYRMNLASVGNFIAEFDMKWKGGPWFQYGLLFRGVAGNEYAQSYMTYISSYDNTLRLIKLDPSILSDPYWGNGGTALSKVFFTPIIGTWYHFKVTAAGSAISIYVDGSLKISVSDSKYSTGTIGFMNWHSGADHAHFDNVVVSVPSITVAIDIKPGSDPNSVNLGEQGLLPVAILGSASFNVKNINPETVMIGGVGLVQKKKGLMFAYEDVNSDGFLDMVVFFNVPELVSSGVLTSSTTALNLTAMLNDGTPITGTDSIRVVP